MTFGAGLGPASAVLATAVVVLISLPPAAAIAAPTVGAATGAGSLAITITDLEPAIPAPGDELVVRGTITNNSAAPVSEVSAILRLSPTPLVDRGEIPEVMGGAGQRFGEAVAGTEVRVAESLPPGASHEFELRSEVDSLGFAGPGVYVTGAEVVGDSGSGPIRQDLDRTFLPWWPGDSAIEPLLLTTLWPLTGAPLRDAEGVLLTEDPAVEMSPAGRLSSLLDAAVADPGSVSLVVDPEAVEAAADLADGYLVRGADGSTHPGTRSSEAAEWLTRLTAALNTAGADAVGSLYARPDIDAARRGRLLGVLLRQQPGIEDASEATLGRSLQGPMVMAPGGVAQPRTLAALAAAGVPVVVLGDAAAPVADPEFFTPSGNVVLPIDGASIPALLLDAGLSDTLALPMGTTAEQTAVRQALLAQTLVTVMELPETSRLVITSPDPAWDPPVGAAEMVVRALTGAPWIQPTAVPTALAREPSSLARTLVGPTEEEEAAELPPAHVAGVRAQYRNLLAYGEVVSDPLAIADVTRTAPTRGLGAWFRGHPEARADLADLVDRQVLALSESVQVVSSGSITVSGTSGTIPITIENAGPHPVTVGLVLSSTPPQLFTADPVGAIVIEPARRTSVEVTAQVAAAGPIPVTIQLVTAEGDPFGDPGQLVVESAAYASVARVLVQLALAALLLAVVVHAVRRARRRRAARATRASDQPLERAGGAGPSQPGAAGPPTQVGGST